LILVQAVFCPRGFCLMPPREKPEKLTGPRLASDTMTVGKQG
jgi:hypothetical protein